MNGSPKMTRHSIKDDKSLINSLKGFKGKINLMTQRGKVNLAVIIKQHRRRKCKIRKFRRRKPRIFKIFLKKAHVSRKRRGKIRKIQKIHKRKPKVYKIVHRSRKAHVSRKRRHEKPAKKKQVPRQKKKISYKKAGRKKIAIKAGKKKVSRPLNPPKKKAIAKYSAYFGISHDVKVQDIANNYLITEIFNKPYSFPAFNRDLERAKQFATSDSILCVGGQAPGEYHKIKLMGCGPALQILQQTTGDNTIKVGDIYWY